MLKRTLLIAALAFAIVLLSTNYLTMQALNQISVARETETRAFRQLHLISDLLTRYILAGDAEDAEAIEGHFEDLRPAREVGRLLNADPVDWTEVQRTFDAHRDTILPNRRSARQLRWGMAIPRLRVIMTLWGETGTNIDALEAIFKETRVLWQQQPLPNHAERRAQILEARAHLDALFDQQQQMHALFNGASAQMRALFLITNLIVYLALTIGVVRQILAYIRRRDAETSRVKAALHDNRAIYNAIIENSHEVVCLLEPQSLRVHHANPAFIALIGRNPTDVPLHFNDFDTSEFEDAEELLADFQKSTSTSLREHLWRARDGELKAVELSASEIRRGGELQWIVLIGRDLSEERQLQAHLTEVDRMAAVGLLASGVGHEINNPLAYVAANLDFVREQLNVPDAPTSAEMRDAMVEALDEAREGATRVRDIVKDLKHYASWEKISRDDVANAEEVLDATLRMAANQLRHRARVQRNFTGEALVRGSESRLGQVFLNLLVNAAQAIPEGRALDNTITVSTSLKSRWVLVSIADTGTGLSEEARNHLFTPFFTTKSADQGSGLGLSICKHIVNGMGGRIEVESTPGQGTTFTLWLPRYSMEDSLEFETDPPELLALEGDRRPGLLIIEDQPPVARAIRRMLDDTFEIHHCELASDAIALLERSPDYDAILCDLMMPQMTGIEFARALEARMPTQVHRLIFMTGGALSEPDLRFMSRRGIPCLDKPFEPDELRRLIFQNILGDAPTV